MNPRNMGVNPVNPVTPVSPVKQSAQVNQAQRQDIRSFNDIFSRAVDQSERLKFSKHAEVRLNSRDVELTPDQLKRVEDGVRAAANKGVADSLVLVDGYALVVNTRSRTVITAMQSTESKIYTNIDGAVIV
ncbi:MAG: flagellar protein [Clostridiales bacterium]|nr:flagellar protein [Clostridiales bacterium]